ncbi:MAG: cytochrome c biogenesis protein CcdA [Anaerolineae bacterium]|nr:cytochrome c biogenesis protein CcdA [Anaerolineae bacterium]
MNVGLGLSAKGKWAAVASFVIPAIVVIVLLFLLISLRDGSEVAMDRLANLLPVGYAFSAGMVASVNPCGFLLLPTFVMYHLGTQEDGFFDQSVGGRVWKALKLGGMATLGFVTIFALVGLVVGAGGQWLWSIFPYASIIIGLLMAGLGVWLLATGKHLGIYVASRVSIAPRRNLVNVFGFGIVYAIGSLGCTLPVFLVVVGSALASEDILASLGQFIGYALGMASVFIAVTVATVLVRGTITGRLKNVIPFVQRANAFFLVGVGIYLVYTWFVQGGTGF